MSALQRNVYLGQLCRDCPRLDHPRLAHDPLMISRLEAAISNATGLTIVAGASDEARTFFVTAVGNSALRLRSTKQLSGIDLHRPDKFVPVSGVLYFRDSLRIKEIETTVRILWKSHIEKGKGMVLFNGVWDPMPTLRSSILEIAKSQHVLLADGFVSGMPDLGMLSGISVKTIALAEDHRRKVFCKYVN